MSNTTDTDDSTGNGEILLGDTIAINGRTNPLDAGEFIGYEHAEPEEWSDETTATVKRLLRLDAEHVDVAEAFLRKHDNLVVLRDPTLAELDDVKSERELRDERLNAREQERKQERDTTRDGDEWKGAHHTYQQTQKRREERLDKLDDL